MHWLPLVAMVIASALPFPPTPLPRLVVAMTADSSPNFDNRLDNVTFTEAGASSPPRAPEDYNSHGDVSQKNYSAAARKKGQVRPRAVEQLQSAVVEDLSSGSQRRQRKQASRGGKVSPKALKAKLALSDRSPPVDSLEQQGGSEGGSESESIRRRDAGEQQTQTQTHALPSQADSSRHSDGRTSLDSKAELEQLSSRERTDNLDALRSDEAALRGAERDGGRPQDGNLLGDYSAEPSESPSPSGVDTTDSVLERARTSGQNQGQGDAAGDERETGGAGLATGQGDGEGDATDTRGAGLATGRGDGEGDTRETQGAGLTTGRGDGEGDAADTRGAGFTTGRGDGEGDTKETRGAGLAMGLGEGGLLADEDLLFLDSHPRVLFSSSPLPPEHPPLLLMLERELLAGSVGGGDGGWGEEEEGEEEEGTEADAKRPHRGRRRRSLNSSSGSRLVQHGHELSMCAERSDWVTDKRTAVDINHNMVTIVPEIPTLSGPIKQFFYETRCRDDIARNHSPGGGANSTWAGRQGVGGCVGVDKRQWNSSCQTKQSFVRALTGDAKRRRWTWIRVNSSCVCVLSRVNKSKPVRINGKR